MDDKYIKDIYDNLGGESVFGNYNDYYSLITSDDSYIKDVYDSKGESVFGSYDDFVSLVKKKTNLSLLLKRALRFLLPRKKQLLHHWSLQKASLITSLL